MSDEKRTHYDGPAGGWGSIQSVTRMFTQDDLPRLSTFNALLRINKPGGFACTSCAWTKPKHPHTAEFCENGAKATAWDLTTARVEAEFFAQHTVQELSTWPDYELEKAGRLTQPMRYDSETDRYVPVTWASAFADIGQQLTDMDPKSVIFYASGKASLETSYMYSLWARLLGSQNLPDSSNMCHESTSVGLTQSLGVPVGTCLLEDFEHCDAIFIFGQNTGVNSPRMLRTLQQARMRGAAIVTFNPIRERGLEFFTDPQSVGQMLTGAKPPISSQYHQLQAGGDIAAMTGMAKLLFEAEDQGRPVIDRAFIAEHTQGFDEFESFVRHADWDELLAESGLSKTDLQSAADVYMNAKATIGVYGMGLTQHRHGVSNVHMFCNFLMMRGNIGRPGAGACPVRGHSNVQGQRTVGMTEKPELAPLDKLAELYDFEPPREKGWDTVESCSAILDGRAQGFIGLGGNLARAVPDTDRMEPAWRNLGLTVNIATKLNRTHLLPGKTCYLLPCLVRMERDQQAGGAQTVTIEDSMSMVHGSVGDIAPASPHLLSEAAIVAGMAKATLGARAKPDWDAWVGDYGLIRDAIQETYPEFFPDFNQHLFDAGGFYKGNAAHERQWHTKSGKAEFLVPQSLNATGFSKEPGRFRLLTIRSNDQFNTTIYGFDDRFRDVMGTRMVVLMNSEDIQDQQLTEGGMITLDSDDADQIPRSVSGLEVRRFNIPRGCIAGYFPELNPLISLTHHALESNVPAAKSVPVRIRA
ncbi:FdhF/YdeP family oxidoreductase [Halothiobacillus sp.]|uniref:FdhF/YdeP family oxidoreductase n=1 Tax=Halothiobacillus sp. TaxID=1891311 RepID=UPI002AD50426|nr:FdhF/YdeP family oxidoreductase [Halothiobacillus sp.]